MKKDGEEKMEISEFMVDVRKPETTKIQDLFDEQLTKLKTITPMGEMLQNMALKETSFDTAAECVCMLGVVQDLELKQCFYCKAVGHRRKACPVYDRLRSRFRGDRLINKYRGKKSAVLTRG